MKWLLLLFCMLSVNVAQAQSMTQKQIWSEYKKLKTAKKAQMAEPLTTADKARMENLIPLDTFLPDRNNKKVKAQLAPIDTKALPDSVDLRYRDTIIKSQDNGKCTAYAGTAAIENLMQRTGRIEGLDLSEWDAWGWYGEYSCEAFIAALTKNYICDEKWYPQYGKRSQNCINKRYVKVAKAIYIDDNPDAMREALARGSVVYIGMATPNDMLKCKSVISPTTTAANGGHALLINGYYTNGDETLAIIKNSWGTDCGDGGYQYFPLSLCRKSGFYCVAWEIQGVDYKTAPVITPTPTVKPTTVPTVKPTPTPTPKPKVCVKYTGMWWWKKCVEWK